MWCLMPKQDGNKVKFIQRQKPSVPFFALLWKWKCCTVLMKIVAAVKLMLISLAAAAGDVWGNFLISNLLIGCLHTCPSLCRNLISNGITVQLRPKQCLLARQMSKISHSEYERSNIYIYFLENPFLSPEVICLTSFNPCVYLQCVKRKIHSLLLCCWQSDMLTYVHSAHFVMENSFMAALKSLLTQSSDSPRPASRSLPTPCFIHTFPTLQFPSSPLYLDLLLGAALTAPSFYFYHFWMLHLLTTPSLLQESIWYKYFTKVKKKVHWPSFCISCFVSST